MKILEVAVVLSAVDKMSQVFNSSVNASAAKLKELEKGYKESFGTGSKLLGAGLALAMSLSPAIEAYADLEESSTRLKTTMMEDGSAVSANFQKINDIAIELGNKLPGNTADFQNMFATLIRGGVSEKSILDGVGKSAAYLAVGLRLPFEEAAKLSAKLKEATGVADGEMLQFMDTIARVNNLGVDTGEMQFAFSRSAGALKLLNLQGLEASKSVASVFAQLIKAGASGETVGTGMTSIFNAFYDSKKMAKFNKEASALGVQFDFIDKKTGQFKGMENMISQFDKLRGFNPQQRANLIQALLGPGQDAAFMNILVSQGVEGYNNMQKRMAVQATLDAKVNQELATLKNVWDASKGTFDNMLAAFGASFAPELKAVATLLGTIAAGIQQFATHHPKIMKMIGLFIAVSAVLLSLVGVFFIVKSAALALNMVLMANPFILIAVAVIALAIIIYTYWDEIVAFFVGVWKKIKQYFFMGWEFIKGLFKSFMVWFSSWGKYIIVPLLPFIGIPLLIYRYWGNIKAFFSNTWAGIKGIFMSGVNWVFSLGSKFFNAGQNIVKSLWNGIKALANKPIEAIKNITQKMRDFLPFSPAKEGAFRDLHRVKIIETIAQSMKPAPIVRAMGIATSAARSAFSVRNTGGGVSRGGGSGGGVVIHYSPNITISGGGVSGPGDNFDALLRKHASELVRLVEDAMSRKNRLSF